MFVPHGLFNGRVNRILIIAVCGAVVATIAAFFPSSVNQMIARSIGRFIGCAFFREEHPSWSGETSRWSTTGKRFLASSMVNDSTPFDPSTSAFSTWVRNYDPQRACNGYTLVFYQQRIPMLIDMNGEVVHAWPNVLCRGRMRLSRDGNLLLIGADNLIREYNWNGRLLWEHETYHGNDFPHHDLRYASEGRVLTIFRDMETGGDYIAEIDKKGDIHWRWDSIDHLDHSRATVDPRSLDKSHINSIQEIPLNKWFEAGDKRFKPGNLIVSAREWNAIFMIDRVTGEIVWEYSGELDGQHEALMIEKGLQGEGNVLVFDNGKDNLHRYRRSVILEIDPTTNAVVSEYSSSYFYTSLHGSQQMLQNGNVMISSALGGRVFEIEPDGEIVWEWVPPFEPRRPHRYPYDYCPRFKAFGSPQERAVGVGSLQPHVDAELYVFDLELGDVDELHAADSTYSFRWLTGAPQEVCRTLVIPPRAELAIGFGLCVGDLSTATSFEGSVAFIAEIESITGQRTDRLVHHTFDVSAGPIWVQQTFPLDTYAYESVHLCLRAESMDEGGRDENIRRIHWSQPTIIPGVQLAQTLQSIPDDPQIVSKHLEALGYVE